MSIPDRKLSVRFNLQQLGNAIKERVADLQKIVENDALPKEHIEAAIEEAFYLARELVMIRSLLESNAELQSKAEVTMDALFKEFQASFEAPRH